jgi:hypothetical protein
MGNGFSEFLRLDESSLMGRGAKMKNDLKDPDCLARAEHVGN